MKTGKFYLLGTTEEDGREIYLGRHYQNNAPDFFVSYTPYSACRGFDLLDLFILMNQVSKTQQFVKKYSFIPLLLEMNMEQISYARVPPKDEVSNLLDQDTLIRINCSDKTLLSPSDLIKFEEFLEKERINDLRKLEELEEVKVGKTCKC